VHAVYGNFPYVLAFVIVLTLLLLARAFRSIVLALKAALLNLVSLVAAFGIVVVVFQTGHGSSLWNVDAIHAINPWIPLMTFAFLFGLSMEYEVFMLTRIREAYDQTGSTGRAVELGLARTGKLVTSGALILMFAFLVLSSSPGFEARSSRSGWPPGSSSTHRHPRPARAALMQLLGRANWWMPNWTRALLLVRGYRSIGTPTIEPHPVQEPSWLR
jgi:putative drug exporter of the RND superfamily